MAVGEAGFTENCLVLRKQDSFYRTQLENYLAQDPVFELPWNLIYCRSTPMALAMTKPLIWRGWGPMAAVAGAFAQFIGRDLLATTVKEIVVENGNDIFSSAGEINCRLWELRL